MLNFPLFHPGFQDGQAGTQEVLDIIGLLFDFHRPGFQAGDVQKVADKTVHPARFFPGQVDQLAPRILDPGQLSSSRRLLRAPVMEDKGVRRSWEIELSRDLSSLSVACRSWVLFRSLGQVSPLDGQSRLAGKSFEESRRSGARPSV